MARKLGGYMNEFKKISGEFRSTWENAINLDEKPKDNKQIEKQLRSENPLESENSISRNTSQKKSTNGDAKMPEIKEVSNADFDKIVAAKKKEREIEVETPKSEKSEWL